MLAKQLGNLVLEKPLTISSNISKKLNEEYNYFLKENGLEEEAILKWRGKLLEYIGQALITHEPNDVWEEVSDWAGRTARIGIQHAIGLDELLQTIKVYREVIWEFVEELHTEKIMLSSFLTINRIIDTILDHIAYIFGVTYVNHHENVLKIARDAAVEVSTPVIRLTKNVGVLPLVGDIDTYRARILMDQSLKRSVDLGISKLIIDLSGVPIVDTMVSNQLFQLASALRLIGVDPILTGIRPEIAQTVVNLGIDFNGIKIMKNLEQALTKLI